MPTAVGYTSQLNTPPRSIGAESFPKPKNCLRKTLPEPCSEAGLIRPLEIELRNGLEVWEEDAFPDEAQMAQRKIASSCILTAFLENSDTLFLSGLGLTSLPDNIGLLKNVGVLQLAGNQLASLPDSVGCMKKLRNLNLSDNAFSAIPRGVFELSRLQCLNLSKNQISDLLNLFANFEVLTMLSLCDNPISRLPISLCALRRTCEVYLFNTHLSRSTIADFLVLRHSIRENNDRLGPILRCEEELLGRGPPIKKPGDDSNLIHHLLWWSEQDGFVGRINTAAIDKLLSVQEKSNLTLYLANLLDCEEFKHIETKRGVVHFVADLLRGIERYPTFKSASLERIGLYCSSCSDAAELAQGEIEIYGQILCNPDVMKSPYELKRLLLALVQLWVLDEKVAQQGEQFVEIVEVALHCRLTLKKLGLLDLPISSSRMKYRTWGRCGISQEEIILLGKEVLNATATEEEQLNLIVQLEFWQNLIISQNQIAYDALMEPFHDEFENLSTELSDQAYQDAIEDITTRKTAATAEFITQKTKEVI